MVRVLPSNFAKQNLTGYVLVGLLKKMVGKNKTRLKKANRLSPIKKTFLMNGQSLITKIFSSRP